MLHAGFWDLTRMLRVSFVWLVERINRHCQGFSFREHTPLQQVKKATVPILFVHGKADTAMCPQLYEVYLTRKEMLLVEGAGHAESIVYVTEEYHGAIQRLLEIELEIRSAQVRFRTCAALFPARKRENDRILV